MAKYIGDLRVQDIIYLVTFEEIIKRKVINIQLTDRGVKVGTDHYATALKYSDENSFISNVVKYDEGRTILFVKIEDAEAEQKRLRTIKFNSLRQAVKKINDEYIEFVEKYFTPKSEISNEN